MDVNVTSRFGELENLYTFLVDDLADRRTDQLPFLYSPMWPITILMVYFGAVYIWVPKWVKFLCGSVGSSWGNVILFCHYRLMENRKPYDLKNLMIGYNLAQVVACYAIIRHFFKYGWTFEYLYTCKLPDYSTDSAAIGFMYGSYFNYAIKTLELVETVLFALRKKQNQISFLHVYHHACTFAIAWIFAKYVGGKPLFLSITSFERAFLMSYSLRFI